MLSPSAGSLCRWSTHQSAAFTNAGSTAITNGFGGVTNAVRVVATLDAFVKIDNNPTATTSDFLLQVDKPEYFICAPSMKIAARGVAGSGTIHVTELSDMNMMRPFRPGITQNVAYTASAGTITNAFGAVTQGVRLVATSAAFVRVGVGAATTADVYLPAGYVEYVICAPGQKASAIQVASGGTLYVTEMSG